MAEATDELREEIDNRRESIGATVDQLENRVHPSRIASRQTGKMRQRFTDMADSVFGNDEPDYETTPARGYAPASQSQDTSLVERARDASGNFTEAPQQLRRQAKGNPAAAGMISFGLGLLLGSILPESRKETQLVAEVQPRLNAAASEAAAAGQGLVGDLREPAMEAVESLKGTAKSAGEEVQSKAQSAAKDVAEEAQP